MKKFVVALLIILSVSVLTMQAVAASGAFVSSPSNNSAPELVAEENKDEECQAKVVVCAYSDRGSLADGDKAKLEAAYDSIIKASDISTLNSQLSALADELQIGTDKLLVKDLFNVGFSDCDKHDDHEGFEVTLKPDVIENFACLMSYNGSAWVVVENVEVDGDASTIKFSMKDSAPYAIVVHDGSAVIDDGGSALPGILIGTGVVVAAGAAGAVVFFYYKKKKTQK